MKYILSIAVIAVAFLGVSSPVQAKRLKALNEENVTKFVEQASQMTSSHSDLSQDKIIRFFNKHLHKDARFKTTIQYIVPGFPPKETGLALDKKSFIESIEEGMKSVEGHKSSTEVQSVEIVSDGKQALVKTRGTESGIMLVPVDKQTTERVPIDGSTQCNQIIRLSKSGVIQLYNAVCETIIEFTGEY